MFWAFFATLILLSSSSFGDERSGGEDDITHPLRKDLIKYEGKIIDSIEIDNREIYDTNVEPYNNFFFRTANKLHIKTRRAVIARELLFETKDLFSVDLVEETTRNLRNRYTIYDSWAEVKQLSDSSVLVRIVTIDEWSFAGGFEISREGNEYRYEVSFEERNFLGLNQFVSLDYIIQERDDDFFESSFRNIRFLGKPISLGLSYSGDPQSEVKQVSVYHPFYSLRQRFAYGFYAGKTKRRSDIFNDSTFIGLSNSASDIFGSSIAYRYGERVRNVVAVLSHDYNFDRVEEKRILSSSPVDSALAISSFPEDSLFHQVGLLFRGALVNFTTFRKIDGFGYTEDFTLGQTVAIGYSRAFDPDFDNHFYDHIYFDISLGHSFANELFYLTFVNTNKFKGSRDYRQTSALFGNYYHRGPGFLTLAFRGAYRRDWRRENSSDLILGGSSGIRGYPTEFKTGDRMTTFSLESRFHPDLHLLSTIWGLAAFIDAGRTYKPGQDVTFKDFYFGGGVGVRVALDRSSKSRFFRIDLAYSETSKWQLSLSTGQYFTYSDHRLFLTSR